MRGEGERIVTLDGEERTLDPSMLAICDAERPAVIAGIFGAEFAEVAEGTTRVLLEAASFDGPAILATSLALGLRTRVERPLREGPAARAAAARHGHRLPPAGRALRARGWCRAPSTPSCRCPSGPAVRMRHARVAAHPGRSRCPPEESAGDPRRLGMAVDVAPSGRR